MPVYPPRAKGAASLAKVASSFRNPGRLDSSSASGDVVLASVALAAMNAPGVR